MISNKKSKLNQLAFEIVLCNQLVGHYSSMTHT